MTVWERAAKSAGMESAYDAKIAFLSGVVLGALRWSFRTVIVLAWCDVWGVI